MIVLHRIDPRRNMARFYMLAIERNLFGEWSLVRTYGRIGRRGVVRCDICRTYGEARIAALRLERAKTRRGYVPSPQQPQAREAGRRQCEGLSL